MIPHTIHPSTLRSLRLARAAMSDARDLVDHGLPGAAKVTLPSAVAADAPLDDDGRARREHLPTDFPRIGGRDLEQHHTAAFTSPWWRDAFRPGERRELFTSYCIGQKGLGSKLRRPCYHVGVDGPGQAWHRIRAMKRRRYGAGSYVGGRYVEDDRNWSEWGLGLMVDGVRPSRASPITVAERGMLVMLPDTLDPALFDRLMTEEILKGSLARWLRTAEGQGHCAMLRVDPAIGQRFTSPSVGTSGDPEPVEDIVMCAQRIAQETAIHAAERIMLAHLKERWPEAA